MTAPVVRIAPSLLAADFGDLKSQIARAEEGGADWLHLDVMDGHFVPNLTIGPPVIRSIRKLTKLPLDTHLMIEEPDRFLEAFRDAGADHITVHYEACRNLNRTLHRIRELGAKAGVSVNPATPVEMLTDVLGDVDLILIMSVNPGFGGQAFLPSSVDRIRRASSMLKGAKSGAFLEVDGGIEPATAPGVVAAGATVLVAGSFIFGSPDIRAAVGRLRAAAR